MIELSRHIESLMLQHDCVIVPGLGGFVTQYVPARRVEAEDLFLPPYRSVGFNPQLTMNDGLLVQSYMQAYDTGYPETVKLVEDAVKQLKNSLQHNGEFELPGIGKLTWGMEGKYNFTPCEAGVLSPELYGLDALPLALRDTHRTTGNTSLTHPHTPTKKVALKRTDKEYTFSISRELANYVAAAAVAILFYLVWAPPVTNSVPTDRQYASTVYEQLFETGQQAVALPKSEDLMGIHSDAEEPASETRQTAEPVPQETVPADTQPAADAKAKPETDKVVTGTAKSLNTEAKTPNTHPAKIPNTGAPAAKPQVMPLHPRTDIPLYWPVRLPNEMQKLTPTS